MRIVGGNHKGTQIHAPKGEATRPTTDRLRETIFNILAHSVGADLTDARVLDLFAGSGAMGLEALSRGAGFALFVDQSAQARGAIRRNVEALGLTGRTRVWRRDATKLGPAAVAPFSVLFADPPYAKGLAQKALLAAAEGGWLQDGAIAVVEEKAGALPEAIDQFTMLDTRKVGDSAIAFLTYDGA
ncbi:MAG: 16S rRNA (guanine(966)-N(2))-methyltransferase RsmD [Pseudomonadota bacterium]